MPGYGDRTGCPNQIKVPKSIRDQFGEAFEKLGGVDELINWARDNKKSFYSLFAKMVTKEIKLEDVNKSQENFVKLIQAQEEQKRIDKGTPVKMIDVDVENLDTNKLNIT